MSTVGAQRYSVIPLSIQKEGDAYLIGNLEMGEFYQFPEQGVKILDMLRAGDSAASIRTRLAAESQELVDVDEFVEQLEKIGFIHPEDQRQGVQQRLRDASLDTRPIFDVDPRIANAIFSSFTGLCYVLIVVFAVLTAIYDKDLRIDLSAFYVETNRTPFLILISALSCIQMALHESGHLLAAARYGIKSRYGISNRLWTIVAESDLTGILTLPKSQRYFPMLAGIVVDIGCAAILTIFIKIMLQYGASAFAVQVIRALILEIIIDVTWQFNIFVKTDIYFVLCNYFGHTDLDKDARLYLRNLAYKLTIGRFGERPLAQKYNNIRVLRIFSVIWLFGRILSLTVLLCVVFPTMARYIESAVHELRGPQASIWNAVDTLLYVSIILTMLAVGMSMWLKQKLFSATEKWRTQ
jgi:putative peptide zinc metalloprotease protein